MDDMILATDIHKKLIAELFEKNDPRRHRNHEYFIAQILELLRKYPEIRLKLSQEELTVNNIIKTINTFFKTEAKKRQLCTGTLQFIIKKNDKQRKKETFLMLLIVGFTLRFIFRRLMNNLKQIGDKMDEEWDDLEGVRNLVNEHALPLPKQKRSEAVEELYSLIENPEANMSMIKTQLDKVLSEKQLELPNTLVKCSIQDASDQSDASHIRQFLSERKSHRHRNK